MSISVATPRIFVVPEIEIPSAEVQVGAAACPSCAEEMLGEYCHACGERSAASHDPSLRGFFREGLGEVVDVDSRSLRTLGDAAGRARPRDGLLLLPAPPRRPRVRLRGDGDAVPLMLSVATRSRSSRIPS